MRHVQGESRYQTTLLPESLDELIGSEHPVRVLDAFVEMLDVRGLDFGKAVPAATGRPPYDPADLLKLYLYGYLHQIRSSRRLERECRRNLEVMWLLNRLAPDFKTIADFRKDNSAGIVGVCRAFVEFCREQALFGAQLVAIDGSKFRSAASHRHAWTQTQVAARIARLDAQIEEYLNALTTADVTEATVESSGATSNALGILKARREELQRMAAQMKASGRRQMVVGEPDASLMHSAQGMVVGYNVQTAVDAKHGLIAHHAITTTANDNPHLYPMALGAKQALAAEVLTALADSGYHNGEQAAACEEAGITPIVPCQRTVNPKGDYFSKTEFVYDTAADTYRCPAGQTLMYRTVNIQEQVRLYTSEACPTCALKARCTKGKRRFVSRHRFAQALEAMNTRARSHPRWMQQRRALAEHPFGTLKRWLGGGRFLVRGLKQVEGEMALAVTAYNLRRAISILGVPTLLARLATS